MFCCSSKKASSQVSSNTVQVIRSRRVGPSTDVRSTQSPRSGQGSQVTPPREEIIPGIVSSPNALPTNIAANADKTSTEALLSTSILTSDQSPNEINKQKGFHRHFQSDANEPLNAERKHFESVSETQSIPKTPNSPILRGENGVTPSALELGKAFDEKNPTPESNSDINPLIERPPVPFRKDLTKLKPLIDNIPPLNLGNLSPQKQVHPLSRRFASSYKSSLDSIDEHPKTLQNTQSSPSLDQRKPLPISISISCGSPQSPDPSSPSSEGKSSPSAYGIITATLNRPLERGWIKRREKITIDTTVQVRPNQGESPRSPSPQNGNSPAQSPLSAPAQHISVSANPSRFTFTTESKPATEAKPILRGRQRTSSSGDFLALPTPKRTSPSHSENTTPPGNPAASI